MNKYIVSLMLVALNIGLLQSCSNQEKNKIPITTKSPQARELFREGMALCDRFHHDDARLKMEQALDLDPDFALGYLGLACSDLRRGSQFSSLLQADELARPVQRKASPTIMLGVTVLNRTDDDLLGHAGRLLDKVSTAERLWINGLRQSSEGDRLGALNSFRGLAMLKPRDPLAHRLLGDCYLRFELPDSAILSYERALELDSTLAVVYNVLGYEYQAVGRLEDAEAMFKRYAEMLPDEPNPQDSYGEFLLRNGRYEESLASYRKALVLDPGFTNARVGVAANLQMLGRCEEARQELSDQIMVAVSEPERMALRLAHAYTHVYEGNHDACLGELSARGSMIDVELDPIDAAYNYDACGEILSHLGRLDKAEEMFKTSLAIVRASDLPDAVRNQYEMFHRVRRSLYVDLPGGRLDRVARQSQQLEIAGQKMADKITSASLGSSLHVLRGMMAFQQKDFAAAISELEQTNTPSTSVNYHLALAYEKLDDLDSAAKYYRKAAEIRRLFDLSHALYFRAAEEALNRVSRPVA